MRLALSGDSPTMLHALADAARVAPDAGVTLLAEDAAAPPEARTYGALLRAAARRAEWLADAGVRPGDRVLLVLPTGFPLLETFFGAQLLGAVPVNAPLPAALERAGVAVERAAGIARDAGAVVCVTERRLLPLYGALPLGAPELRRLVEAPDSLGEAAATPTPACAADDVAFRQYTSGATAEPRGVVMRHRNVAANCAAVRGRTPVYADDVFVNWVPLYHDLGLIASLSMSLFAAVPVVMLSPAAFLTEPMRWLRALSTYGGSVSHAPNFALARCVRRAEPEGLELSRLRVLICGGEPVDPATVERFEATFARSGLRPGAVFPAYGLAECAVASAVPVPGDTAPRFDRVEAAALAAGRAVPAGAVDEAAGAGAGVGAGPGAGAGAVDVACVGPVLPSHELRVVDDAGADCAEREVGELLLRGPSITTGYWRRPDASAELFRDGWLATGDLGYVAGGRLHVCGRRKELVIVHGVKHHPHDLERAAMTVPGVRSGGVVAFSLYDGRAAEDTLVLVCETRATDAAERTALAAAVREAVQSTCGVRPSEVALVAPGSVPKTSSGKLQRAAARTAWVEGTLAPQRSGRRELGRLVLRSGLGLAVAGARRWLGKR